MKRQGLILSIFLIVLGFNYQCNAVSDLNEKLIRAVRIGFEQQVVLLLEQGADVTYQNEYGATALMYAAQNGQWRIVKFLLDAGAHVNQVNNQNKTALFYAADNGMEQAIKLLLQAGAHVDHVDDKSKTALFYAVAKSNIQAVKLLLDAGANVNHIDAQQTTVLFEAIGKIPVDGRVLDLLFDAGANVSETVIKKFYSVLEILKKRQPDKVRFFQAHVGLSIAKIKKSFLEMELAQVKKELEDLSQAEVQAHPEESQAIEIERLWKKDFTKAFKLYVRNQPNNLADFIFNTSSYAQSRNFTSQVIDALRRPIALCQPLLDDLADTSPRKKIAHKMIKVMRHPVMPKNYKKPLLKVEDID